MSSHGMAWARQQKTGNATAKAVLLLLGELVNDEGETTRGQQYLSDILEVHIDSIRRALGRLETTGLISRERRQASDTKRLADRTKLMMQSTFEITNKDPETEPSTESGSPQTEPSTESGREPSTVLVNEPSTESGSKDNLTTNSQLTLSGAEPLFEAATSTAIAVPADRPEALIAKRAYDGSQGALKYMAVLKLSQEAMNHGYSPRQVDAAIQKLWKAGRAVNAQTLGQYLQGIINPAGQTPKPSTTNQRVGSALDRAARYEQEASHAKT